METGLSSICSDELAAFSTRHLRTFWLKLISAVLAILAAVFSQTGILMSVFLPACA
jgi:uncharacterized membrane protein